jgi:predicted transcriptional regulator
MWQSPLGMGPLETAIMHALWNTSEWVNIQGICDSIDYHRPVAYTTVSTVTGILYGKGLVHRMVGHRAGHYGSQPWWYRAAQSQAEHIGDLIAALLDYSPSPTQTLAHALATTRTAIQINDAIRPSNRAECPEENGLIPGQNRTDR